MCTQSTSPLARFFVVIVLSLREYLSRNRNPELYFDRLSLLVIPDPTRFLVSYRTCQGDFRFECSDGLGDGELGTLCHPQQAY